MKNNLINWLKSNDYKFVMKQDKSNFIAYKDIELTDNTMVDFYEINDDEKLPIKKGEWKKL